MRRIIMALLAAATMATMAPSTGMAGQAIPDKLNLRRGVVFDHTTHAGDKVGKCEVCHDIDRREGEHKWDGTTGPIQEFRDNPKAWAHRNCIECHELFDEGPAKNDCAGCHRRMHTAFR